jgi:uncharacterized protein (DUF2267 family)
MNYDTFVERVRQKTGLDRDHAEVAIQSVLSALGERLSEKEARDLASELPRELKPTLENVPGHGRRYRADDFVRLVGDRERVAEPAARLHTQAVLSTMSEAVSRGELADILAEMWADPEFDELWAEPEAASTGPPATASSEAQVSYEEFLSRVQQRTGLDRAATETLTQATLATLAERITRGEADDLAAQLPIELRPWLEHIGSEAERFSAREFIRRVEHRVPRLDRQNAEDAVAAVLVTVREVVSGKELHDLTSQLPADMRALFSRVGVGGTRG